MNATSLSRNTTPYGVLQDNTEYDFVVDSMIHKQNNIIKSTTKGGVEFVGINSGGSLYRIGDQIVFDNNKTDGFGASAEVSRIGGQRINNISVAKTTVSNVEFYPLDGTS